MNTLTRHLVLASIAFAVVALVVGVSLDRQVQRQLHQALKTDLETILAGHESSMREWIQSQERATSLAAQDDDVREPALVIFERAKAGASAGELFALPERQILEESLAPTLHHFQLVGYALVLNQKVVASSEADGLGLEIRPETLPLLERLSAGESVLTRPQVVTRPGARNGTIEMWVASPILGFDQKMAGILALRIDPNRSFTAILSQTPFGQTGETYAFDREGLMLSTSRFEAELEQSGLLARGEDSNLNVMVRDPGAQLSALSGTELAERVRAQPSSARTLPVREATETGKRGQNVRGYRDYRGETVVGAWSWLPEYGFGIVSEIAIQEAFASTRTIKRSMRALVGGLLLLALLLILGSLAFKRLEKWATATKRLGPYTLVSKLGEGGMGSVYLARHALLRRPTALKVIRQTELDERTSARFEREVQATATLCHPNTIVIFDYGRTREGVFYCAMEYLNGVTLDTLIERFGPLPEARVIHILLQCLGSLSEAHEQGMVHRDIKPANIMLSLRGGVADLAKVLDFGLVKTIAGNDDAALTVANTITGTPHYMAPEAIAEPETVDARSDLYAIGAVGYYLLTGSVLFDGPSIMAVLTKQMVDVPERPSLRAKRPIHEAVEHILLKSLSKTPDERYASAREMSAALEATRDELGLTWSQELAHDFWMAHPELNAVDAGTSLGPEDHAALELDSRTGASAGDGTHDASKLNGARPRPGTADAAASQALGAETPPMEPRR